MSYSKKDHHSLEEQKNTLCGMLYDVKAILPQRCHRNPCLWALEPSPGFCCCLLWCWPDCHHSSGRRAVWAPATRWSALQGKRSLVRNCSCHRTLHTAATGQQQALSQLELQVSGRLTIVFKITFATRTQRPASAHNFVRCWTAGLVGRLFSPCQLHSNQLKLMRESRPVDLTGSAQQLKYWYAPLTSGWFLCSVPGREL